MSTRAAVLDVVASAPSCSTLMPGVVCTVMASAKGGGPLAVKIRCPRALGRRRALRRKWVLTRDHGIDTVIVERV